MTMKLMIYFSMSENGIFHLSKQFMFYDIASIFLESMFNYKGIMHQKSNFFTVKTRGS